MNRDNVHITVFCAVLLVALLVLFCVFCVRTVPTGYTGILTTFGRVEDKTMESGLHIKSPFQRIIKMDNRTQKEEIKTQAFSSDIQQVDVVMSINYRIDMNAARTLYKTVGTKYYDTILFPRILENTKAVFAKYTAESLVGNRNVLSVEIQEKIKDDVSQYGITIVSYAVEDVDFTDAFTAAVESKQVAAQNKLAEETRQAQKTMEQEAIAKRSVIDAEAAAEVARIQAEADLQVTKIQADAAEYAGLKEAAKNKAISDFLTSDLLRYYYILQWDGKLPNYYMGSGNGDLLLSIPAQ